MGPQAAGLGEDEDRAIARFITAKEFDRANRNRYGRAVYRETETADDLLHRLEWL